MARRKKTVKRHSVKRRRSRAVGKIDFTGIALTIGGAVAANIITNQLAKSNNSLMQKVAPFAGLGAGIVLPMFVKGDAVKQLSVGLIAGGGVAALGSNGLKVIGFMNRSIAYPGGYSMPALPRSAKGLVSGFAPNQGVTRGTHSNFSGSRQSQMNTIAGIAADDLTTIL